MKTEIDKTVKNVLDGSHTTAYRPGMSDAIPGSDPVATDETCAVCGFVADPCLGWGQRMGCWFCPACQAPEVLALFAARRVECRRIVGACMSALIEGPTRGDMGKAIGFAKLLAATLGVQVSP